ncbi:MAG: methyltransferase domain-containing protein [Gammaproteobacteria bacterium]|nr:methyltransferase domain-containing protein [Gammaproteobacteria bacterium]
MTRSDAEKWNRIYAAGSHGGEAAAARVLVENLHLLPEAGDALDLACGEGANALLLARCGLDTSAWDISGVVLKRLAERAESAGLSLRIEQRDVSARPPGAACFDVIVVKRFLDRALVPSLLEALRPGGLIFYQTFIREAVGRGGPSNPAYRLDRNELQALFSPLRLLVYREEGAVGDTARGFRNEALLVARKE